MEVVSVIQQWKGQCLCESLAQPFPHDYNMAAEAPTIRSATKKREDICPF